MHSLPSVICDLVLGGHCCGLVVGVGGRGGGSQVAASHMTAGHTHAFPAHVGSWERHDAHGPGQGQEISCGRRRLASRAGQQHSTSSLILIARSRAQQAVATAGVHQAVTWGSCMKQCSRGPGCGVGHRARASHAFPPFPLHMPLSHGGPHCGPQGYTHGPQCCTKQSWSTGAHPPQAERLVGGRQHGKQGGVAQLRGLAPWRGQLREGHVSQHALAQLRDRPQGGAHLRSAWAGAAACGPPRLPFWLWAHSSARSGGCCPGGVPQALVQG